MPASRDSSRQPLSLIKGKAHTVEFMSFNAKERRETGIQPNENVLLMCTSKFPVKVYTDRSALVSDSKVVGFSLTADPVLLSRLSCRRYILPTTCSTVVVVRAKEKRKSLFDISG